MTTEKIFVGREVELQDFMSAMERPAGEAVLVVGQAGMGKTMLVNKMARLAEKHPDLKCGWVRYEVTPTDSVDSTMSRQIGSSSRTRTCLGFTRATMGTFCPLRS